MSPVKRCMAVERVREKFEISQRRACQALGHPRSTQRYERRLAGDEAQLVEEIVKLATDYGRYGYRRITAMLREQGWRVNHKRVERLWRQEGLSTPFHNYSDVYLLIRCRIVMV